MAAQSARHPGRCSRLRSRSCSEAQQQQQQLRAELVLPLEDWTPGDGPDQQGLDPFWKLRQDLALNVEHSEGRTLYVTRHGESEYNLVGRIGGNSLLTHRGQLYARALGAHFNKLSLNKLTVVTSTLKRTQMTAAFVHGTKLVCSALDEINSGTLTNMTYDDIKRLHPEEYDRRKRDKLRYCYPQGESYVDCCVRVAPLIRALEMRQRDHFLIVGHQGILRCILGFLLQLHPEDIPHLAIAQHAILRLTWTQGRYSLDVLHLPINDYF